MSTVCLASPIGFEPTAPGLGILCSILLSYGDLEPLSTGHPVFVNASAPRCREQVKPGRLGGTPRDYLFCPDPWKNESLR